MEVGRGKVVRELVKCECQHDTRAGRQEGPPVNRTRLVAQGEGGRGGEAGHTEDSRCIDPAFHCGHSVAALLAGAHQHGANGRGSQANTPQHEREEHEREGILTIKEHPAGRIGQCQAHHQGRSGDKLEALKHVCHKAGPAIHHIAGHARHDRGVAGLVSGNGRVNLVRQVRAHAAGPGGDAPPDPRQERHQRDTRHEADEHIRSGYPRHDEPGHTAHQPQPYGHQTRHQTGPVGHLHGGLVALARGRNDAPLTCGGGRYPREAGKQREERSHHTGNPPPDCHPEHRIVAKAPGGLGGGGDEEHAGGYQQGQPDGPNGQREHLVAEIDRGGVPHKVARLLRRLVPLVLGAGHRSQAQNEGIGDAEQCQTQDTPDPRGLKRSQSLHHR